MNAGFAAGFFGEATNIMRETDKRTREDELLAKELEQKDKDWARSTQHDLNMVSARYDLETKAARTKKVDDAATTAGLLLDYGFSSEDLSPYLDGSDRGLIKLNSLLSSVDGLSKDQVSKLRATVGAGGITTDVATTVKGADKSTPTGDFAVMFAGAANKSTTQKPEQIKVVVDTVNNSMMSDAQDRLNKLSEIALDETQSSAARGSASKAKAELTIAIEQASKNNPSLLMNSFGVKAVYDALNNPGMAGYEVANNPMLRTNSSVVDRAQAIMGTKTFLQESVDGPYAALDLINNNKDVLIANDKLGPILLEYATVFDKSFLPPELESYYTSFLNK